ncbi:MAG: hypothetical protein AB1551_03625 [Actinomycetota bacterium]
MRALLEFLGILEPDRARREPVTLPSWAFWTAPLLVLALVVASTLVLVVIRAFF